MRDYGPAPAGGSEGFTSRWVWSLPALVFLAAMVAIPSSVDTMARPTNGEQARSTNGNRNKKDHLITSVPLLSSVRKHDAKPMNNGSLSEEDIKKGNRSFSMTKVRTYGGPTLSESAVVTRSSRFPQPAAETVCDRWAVILATSTVEPTYTVQQLAGMKDWCVVVVAGDKHASKHYGSAGSKHHGLETVTYLSPSDQEAMPYRITKLLPWSHLSRKSVGYLYAIHHGAKVIFDVDDGMHVYTSDNGIPYADNGNVPPASSSYTTASLAHNPYPCFGAPSNVWPRGLSQESTDDPNICDSVANVSNQNLSDGNPRLLGVVQSLVNKYPDVDAKCRLCDGDCGDRQFHFARPLPAAEGDGSAAASAPLKIVPSSAFTPYNAQLGPQRDTAEDMAAEEYMHEQTGTLVEFLAEYRSRDAETRSARDVTLAERIEALAVTMYEYAIVEEEDVILTHAWLHDILAAGSTPGASAVDDKHHTPRNLSQTARSSATRQLDDIIPTNEELHRDDAGLVVVDGNHAPPPPATSVATVTREGNSGDSLLLVIAIPSARHERRRAIRESWLAWADDRVAIRFFADFPADDVVGAEDIREALLAEVEEHGDVIIMDLDRGMNFTRRLLWAMEWMSNHYVFEYFIKLDDDYFLCLQRLLAELELMSHTLRQNAPYLYAGHAYCTPGKTRIDEAYLLLSSKLVHRVLDIPNLLCGGHAGLTAGWWFTDGNMANTERDIHWVHDPRLDHHGGLWKADMTSEQQSKVCFHRMGVHHTFAENMGLLWARAKDNPGPMPQKMEELFQYPKYNCPSLETGISNEVFFGDDMQPCQSFKPPPGKIGTLHCGEEGC